MESELSKAEMVMQSITTKFAKSIISPFAEAVNKYKLISDGDRIAVCVSGGKDSMLLAKLMQYYLKAGNVDFTVRFISMNPGYDERNLTQLERNADMLDVPIEIFQTNVLKVAESSGKSPCGLCARMRRGYLYNKAVELGCNKIALGHHFNDVIETTLMGMLYGAQIQGMLPKLKSRNYEGVELIRPLYCVHESDISDWVKANELEFITCGCKHAKGETASKRQEIKKLIVELSRTNPKIEKNIFNSIHTADVDTLVGYKLKGVKHSFLERFDFVENEH